jgi:hypothetical protein
MPVANPNAPDRFNPESLRDEPLIHRPHLVKGSEYRSEREIRVVTACSDSEPGALVRNIAVADLVHEVVISPLLPFAEAEAVEAQIQKHPWKQQSPAIRRSSILGGRNLSRDELRSATSEFLVEKPEPCLPPLIDTL